MTPFDELRANSCSKPVHAQPRPPVPLFLISADPSSIMIDKSTAPVIESCASGHRDYELLEKRNE